MSKALPAPLLSGRTRDFPLEALLAMESVQPTMPAERQLLAWVLPPWQRPECWAEAQKIAFIEGIFLGLGTGYYVVHEPDWEDGGECPMAGWLLDGQQRLTAIRDFVENRFPVFDGIYYRDLDEIERRRRFLRVVFPCVVVEYQPDEAKLKELYRRLNFGGTPHTQDDLKRLDGEPVSPPADDVLDARLRQHGMVSLADLLANKRGALMLHAGVTDMPSFAQWLRMRFEEMQRMRLSLEVDAKDTGVAPEENELYEWVLAHAAVLGEVLAHFEKAQHAG